MPNVSPFDSQGGQPGPLHIPPHASLQTSSPGAIARAQALPVKAGSGPEGTDHGRSGRMTGSDEGGGSDRDRSCGDPSEDGTILRLSPNLARMPVGLSVAVPIREFRFHNLLSLRPGIVVESSWSNGEDLPLISGEVQLAWTEFEVVDTRLAVRVTRLA